MLFQVQPQANHVVVRPAGHEFAKRLLLTPFGVINHHGVLAHGFHLAEVANDGRVLGLTLQHVVGHHQQPLNVELPEHFLELGPLFIHYAPHKTRLKDLAGELGQVPVRAQLFEVGFALGFGQQRFEGFFTALALAGVVVEVAVVGESHGLMVSPSQGADTTLPLPMVRAV